MYFTLLCIHLICAICFVGYVFFDACIYIIAYKKLDKEQCDLIKHTYTKNGGGAIFGILFLLLLISGGLLLRYRSVDLFDFSYPFAVFLAIKLFLILLILILTLFAIIRIRILKKSDPFKGKSHLIAFILSLLIAILAKAMQFY